MTKKSDLLARAINENKVNLVGFKDREIYYWTTRVFLLHSEDIDRDTIQNNRTEASKFAIALKEDSPVRFVIDGIVLKTTEFAELHFSEAEQVIADSDPEVMPKQYFILGMTAYNKGLIDNSKYAFHKVIDLGIYENLENIGYYAQAQTMLDFLNDQI